MRHAVTCLVAAAAAALLMTSDDLTAQQNLLALLREIVAEVGNDRIPEPHDYENAVWAGYRYCEVLPIPLAARQKLLELDDTVSRLEIIQQFLQQRGLAQ